MAWIVASELLIDKTVLADLYTSAKRSTTLFALPVHDQAIPGARANLMSVAKCIVALNSMLVHFCTEDTNAVTPETVDLGMDSIQTAFCFVDCIDDQKLVFVLSQLL
jgi:hypothetical protein